MLTEKRLKWEENSATFRLSIAAHPCNTSIWEVEAEGSRFKVILSYVVSLRPARGTWGPV